METKKQRYIWIDWMKVIGLYFIILGHFFPPYKSYIYAFNVPLFFIISGFLTKKESKNEIFYSKLLHNLIIPMCLILSINYIWDIYINSGQITFINILRKIKNGMIGMHGINKGGGLGTCWFIYTLIILKITYQLFSTRIQISLLIVSPIIAILLNYKEISPGNAILNTTVAYPFWWIGTWLNKKKIFFSYHAYHPYKSIFMLCICIIMLYTAGHTNQTPFVFINGYGNNIAVFIIGALAGTYIIYYLCKIIERYCKSTKYIVLLSSGSIIILGLHYIFIDILHQYNLISGGARI